MALTRLLTLAALALGASLLNPVPARAQFTNWLAARNPTRGIFWGRPEIRVPPAPGSSGLWVRSQYSAPIYVAVAYYSAGASSISAGNYTLPATVPSTWTVSGWTRVPPGQRRQLIGGDLRDRYYYYYAVSGGRAWSGSRHHFYVPPQPGGAFTYSWEAGSPSSRARAEQQARGRGYVRRGFRAVNTGSAAGYTVTLRR